MASRSARPGLSVARAPVVVGAEIEYLPRYYLEEEERISLHTHRTSLWN